MNPAPAPRQKVSTSDALRCAADLAFRHRRSFLIVLFFPVVPIAVGFTALAGRLFISAHDSHSTSRAVVAAAIPAFAIGVAVVIGFWQGTTGAVRLASFTSAELDRRLLPIVAEMPTLAIEADPTILDQLEVVRTRRQSLLAFISLVRIAIIVAMSIIISSALLLSVDIRLVVAPLATPLVVIAYYLSERAIAKAEQSVAPLRRVSLALFDLGITAGPSKEIRTSRKTHILSQLHREINIEIDERLRRAAWRSLLLRGAAWLGISIAVATSLAIVLTSGQGQLQAGDVFIISIAMIQLANVVPAAASAASQFGDMLEVARTVTRLLHLNDAPVRTPLMVAGQDDTSRPGLRLDKVTFRYPGAERDALSDINLELQSGSVVALVGQNGAGKSTLVNVITRLYLPTDGQLLLDVPEIGDDREWYRNVSIVCQQFACFQLIARETVGVGDLSRVSDENAVLDAIRRADADPVLADLPMGLSTRLGARVGGRDLSLGQWQRLAVARGFMRRSALVLALDEPTAAIDPISEQRLLERCFAEARSIADRHGAVVVVVSHRYAVVRHADLIVVLEQGRVVEQGGHNELLHAGGRYSTMYQAQVAAYR